MMFSRAAEGSQWIHEFYEQHGPVVQNVRYTVITRMMKLGTDPDVLDDRERHVSIGVDREHIGF